MNWRATLGRRSGTCAISRLGTAAVCHPWIWCRFPLADRCHFSFAYPGLASWAIIGRLCGTATVRLALKKLFCSIFAVACSLLSFCGFAFSQDGGVIYAKRCAGCHAAPKGRTPSVEALHGMSATAILRALDSGVMRDQAAGLSAAERAAIAEYLAGAASKSARAAASQAGAGYCTAEAPSSGRGRSEWNGFGAGLENARFQTKEAAGLTQADVPKLRLKWAFSLGDITNSRGQPVVVGGRVFAVGATKVFALDAKSGCLYWTFTTEAPVRSGVVAGASAIYFGDSKANVYAVEIATGKLVWKTRVDEHPAAVITDTPALADGVLYLGVSSYEELVAQNKAYACCTFRGSVVAVDAASGKTVWKTYTVESPHPVSAKNAETRVGQPAAGTQRFGPSGVSVWSTPTVDVKRNVVYVSTGDNYSDPATDSSDAVLALERASGKILWSRQMTEKDAYNVACEGADGANCPEAKGPDFDFGQPPILVTLANGAQELVLAQKSGMAWAIDPDQQGKVLWQAKLGKGSSLGGSMWGSASDGQSVYVAISDLGFRAVKDQPGKFELDPAVGGGLYAVDLASGKMVWNATPVGCGGRKNCSPAQPGAVTAIPGVVFEGSMDGHLRAYASSSGEVVWDFDTAREYDAVNGEKARGGSIDAGGVAVAGGMVYGYSGYGQWGGMAGNVLLAFTVEGK